MSYKEQSVKAGSLRKSSNFQEALSVFESLFTDYLDDCNEFDWWGYSQCLLKLDHYQKALEISGKGLEKYPDSKYIKNVYCWALYHTVIKPEPVTNESNFLEAANKIVDYCNNDRKYSAFNKTVFQVIDYLEMNYNLNKASISEWLDKLDTLSLDTNRFTVQLDGGKRISLASEKEKYFMIKAKLLHENDKFTECIPVVEEALASQLEFTNYNDIWLRRLKALSLYEVGKHKESINEFLEILKIKQEWFIKKELAEVYYSAGMIDEALIKAIDAADDKGKDEMKVNLYMLLAKLFLSKGMKEEAALHAKLTNIVRLEQNWPIDVNAERIIAECDISDKFPSHIEDLMKMATECWNAYCLKHSTRFRGTIKSILPHGKAGFISSDGKDFYFKIKEVSGIKPDKLIDSEVTFTTDTSFDKSKGLETTVAVNIKPLSAK